MFTKSNTHLKLFIFLPIILSLLFSCDKDDDSEINIEKVYNGDVIIAPDYHNGNYETPEDFAKAEFTKINGSLTIIYSDNLEFLIGLKEITGDLNLGYRYTEDGSGFIRSNDFINLKGLDNLKTVGGNFHLIGNGNLKNIDGIINLTHIGGSIDISANPLLENIDGLINVTSELNNDFILYGNKSLKNINGLTNAKILSLNTLSFGILDNLTDLNVLSNLTSLNTLSIFYPNNQAISKMDFLANLKALNSLKIIEADYIKNLDWLSISSTSLKDVILKNNKALNNLKGLSAITQIEGSLQLSNLDVNSVQGLENLVSVGSLTISNNDLLENLDGLLKVNKVDYLYIDNNSSLVSFCGLKNADLQTVFSNINSNSYNPTLEQIKSDDECSN